MGKKRMTVTIPRKSPWLKAARGLMAASAVIRGFYYIVTEGDGPLQLWLPVGAAVIFLAGTALGGRRAKQACLLATFLGVVFFLEKARTFSPVHQALCSLLYLTVLTLVTLTLCGFLPTKKLLYPLFGLPLAVHTGMDLWGFFHTGDAGGAPEASVLCIMAGLLCLSIGLEAKPLEREAGK